VTHEINGVVDLPEGEGLHHAQLHAVVRGRADRGEALARTLIDKLNLIGNDKGGLYLFDRDLEGMKGPGRQRGQGQ
jgi:ferritin